MHDLVNRDHEPEEVLDCIFARTLDGLDPPDDGPAPVEKHMRAEDEQEPAVVHWRQPDGRDKAQGVAQAVRSQACIEEAVLRLAESLELGLEHPVTDEMGYEQVFEDGHDDLLLKTYSLGKVLPLL